MIYFICWNYLHKIKRFFLSIALLRLFTWKKLHHTLSVTFYKWFKWYYDTQNMYVLIPYMFYLVKLSPYKIEGFFIWSNYTSVILGSCCLNYLVITWICKSSSIKLIDWLTSFHWYHMRLIGGRNLFKMTFHGACTMWRYPLLNQRPLA